MQNCVVLEEMGLKCNPASTKANYRTIIFSKLPALQKLDGLSLSDRDRATVDQGSIEMNPKMIQDYLKTQKKNEVTVEG